MWCNFNKASAGFIFDNLHPARSTQHTNIIFYDQSDK